jgi:hypothetical protein
MGCGEGWVRVAVVRAGEVGDLAEGACGGLLGPELGSLICAVGTIAGGIVAKYAPAYSL